MARDSKKKHDPIGDVLGFMTTHHVLCVGSVPGIDEGSLSSFSQIHENDLVEFLEENDHVYDRILVSKDVKILASDVDLISRRLVRGGLACYGVSSEDEERWFEQHFVHSDKMFEDRWRFNSASGRFFVSQASSS